MKFLNTALFAFFVITSIVSCKKDNDNNSESPAKTIEGRWVGTYLNDASGNTYYYSFNIKAGGVIEEISSTGEKLGSGTWILDDHVFTAHYSWSSTSSFSVLGAYDKNENALVGAWGYGGSTTDGGSWQMSKSN